MKIDLRGINRFSDGIIPIDYTFSLSDLEIGGEFPFCEKIHASGSIKHSTGVFILKAKLDTVICVHCSRCYREIRRRKDLEVNCVLSAQNKGESDDLEMIYIESEVFDLDEVLSSFLILSMDMVNLCSEDCKGICQKCNANLNEGICGCEKTDKKTEF